MDRSRAAGLFPSAAVYTNPAILAAFQRYCGSTSTDSKSFVDRPLKAPPQDVLDAFETAAKSAGTPGAKEIFASFFDTYFMSEPDGAKYATGNKPKDIGEERPKFLQRDGRPWLPEKAESLAIALKKLWVKLYREPDENSDGDQSSLIPMKHPFFVAGGRFRECYYWDSYWIVKGLLASDMPESARFVVQNMLDLVDRIGFMPNANRVYYLNRSQPPLLALTVAEVFKRSARRTDDIEWLRSALPVLVKEYNNFVSTHRPPAPAGPNNPSPPKRLAVYRVDSNDMPRPEAWRVDVEAAERYRNRGAVHVGEHFPDAKALYQHLAAGAASGWDYSSRWSPPAEGAAGRLGEVGLESMRTSDIVPVCLNSILVATELTLSELYEIVGSKDEQEKLGKEFFRAAMERKNDMNALLWSNDHGMWVDLDMVSGKSTGVVAASGLFPLWAKCWPADWKVGNAKSFVSCLSKSGLVQHGGLATTVNKTGQQWDFPNSWPPLVELAVSGLENLEAAFPKCGAEELAHRIAGSSLRGIYRGWKNTSFMHEKYDAEAEDGAHGAGGEYDPQVGFGWTNGVALDLMRRGYWF